MRRLKHTLAVLAAAFAIGASAHTLPSLAVTDAEVRADSLSLGLEFTIDPSALDISSNRRLTLIPVVAGADTTAAMPQVVVAGRMRYIRDLRRSDDSGANLLRAGKDAPFVYRASMPLEPWTLHSRIEIEADETGCCGNAERRATVPVALIDLRPAVFAVPPDYSVKAPAATDNKTIELSGSAYIDFRVNRTEIDPLYRRNPEELAVILNTIDTVCGNPDATVNRIEIKGFASPEGSYSNNTRLAKGRTEALKDYVMGRYGFKPEVFTTSFEPEDWQGLRAYLIKSALPNRDAILALVDSDMAPDAKDHAIRRRFPADYKFLLDNVYPGLRHSDYKVNYTIRSYTDIDEIRRIMEERPGNLSLNEFYLLAHSYEPGSDQYNCVFDTAVRIYPADPVSNLNAAAVAVNRGDFEGAERFLRRCADRPEAAYLRGVALARQGQYHEALPYLTKAKADGVAEAAAPLENLEKIIDRQQRKIEYIPDESKIRFSKE